MSKNVILILDHCQSFALGLKRYAEIENRAIVHLLTEVQEIGAYAYDYLLVDEERYEKLLYQDRRLYRLVMGNKKESMHEGCISRHSKASHILSQLLDEKKGPQQQMMATIFSMSGGTGKSALAAGLCDGAETLGKGSLLISFASYVMESHNDLDLSLIVYYLHQHGSVPMAITAAAKDGLRSTKLKLNAGLKSPEDCLYLTPAVLKGLMEWMISVIEDRWVIIESPWHYGEQLQVILQYATYRLLVADQRHTREQIESWQEKYQQLIGSERGFYLIQNKNSGTSTSEGFSIPLYDSIDCKKGLKEWTSKYLLTSWIRR
ncbi:MAG: hypothetical protein JXO44_08145 [Clostridia bacterium]|nr:hypothetical protein [Clostridia bacterium]